MSERPGRSLPKVLSPITSAGPPKHIGPARGSVVLPSDVKKIIAYMRDHLGDRVTMADLIRLSGVAARTLRRHFHTFLGISPLEYLRGMRLAALREELLHAAQPGSITEIAARYGFHHLGRFSAEYRRRFSEHPSSTLRRAHEEFAREISGRRGKAASTCPDRGRDFSRFVRASRERPSVVLLRRSAGGQAGGRDNTAPRSTAASGNRHREMRRHPQAAPRWPRS